MVKVIVFETLLLTKLKYKWKYQIENTCCLIMCIILSCLFG